MGRLSPRLNPFSPTKTHDNSIWEEQSKGINKPPPTVLLSIWMLKSPYHLHAVRSTVNSQQIRTDEISLKNESAELQD